VSDVIISNEEWKLGYVLANFKIKEPIEDMSNTIAIVPFNDFRLYKIQENSKGAKKLLNGFRDEFGNVVHPSALIYRYDAPEKVKSISAMVDFRNCVAISFILPGWGQMNFSQPSSPSNPLWSDFFYFYPVFVSSRDTLAIMNPALSVGSSENAPFSGMPSPYVKQYNSKYMVDINLLNLLLLNWGERYINPGRETWDKRKLFRSLEMAYRALALPIINEGGVNDFGSSISLWVSAFEILAHPKNEDVNKTIVFELLRKARWNQPDLLHKYFRIRIGKKRRMSVTLAERLYNGLYEARNAFLHGNAIHVDHWRYKGRKMKTALGNVAPVLYRTALMSYLGWSLPSLTTDFDERLIQVIIDQIYEDFLTQFVK
jgi:hypothetical protein